MALNSGPEIRGLVLWSLEFLHNINAISNFCLRSKINNVNSRQSQAQNRFFYSTKSNFKDRKSDFYPVEDTNGIFL